VIPQQVGDGAALGHGDTLRACIVVLEQLVAGGGPPLGIVADVERRHPILRRLDPVAIAVVDELRQKRYVVVQKWRAEKEDVPASSNSTYCGGQV
jgi:hypothetical protein